jgi:hypothetical protein
MIFVRETIPQKSVKAPPTPIERYKESKKSEMSLAQGSTGISGKMKRSLRHGNYGKTMDTFLMVN